MRSRVALAALTVALTPATSEASRPPGHGDHERGQRAVRPSALERNTREQVKAVLAAGTPGVIVTRHDRRGREATVAAGTSDLATGRAVRPTDRFFAGSTTKTFVAATLLRLTERGQLRLDDPVERWLPGLVPEGRGGAITIRQLLSHRSGLAEFSDDPAAGAPAEANPDHAFTLGELAAFALAKPPVSEPGGAFHYANTNYVLAGLVIEAATGQPWPRVVERETIRRAGLRHTSLGTGRTPGGPFLQGYAELTPGTPLTQLTGAISPSFTGSAGQAVSTADDLAQFSRALLGGKLLRRASLAEMQRVIPVEGGGSMAYGLGLYRVDTSCGPAWGHDGQLFGTGTVAMSTPDARRQVVTVVNRAPKAGDASAAALFERAFCDGSR